MNKNLFSILVILMSLSLIGIIFVQAYYINYSLETKEDQFAFNVKKVLSYTSNQVTDIEYKKYVIALNALIARGQEPDTSAIRSIRVYKQNKDANQIVVYDTGGAQIFTKYVSIAFLLLTIYYYKTKPFVRGSLYKLMLKFQVEIPILGVLAQE